jgi:ABC-type bacteriocin/lantibiotic exporter with double-glycine peptidase domain
MDKKIIKINLLKLLKDKRQMYCGLIILASFANYFKKNISSTQIAELFGGNVAKGSVPAALSYAAIKLGMKIDYISEIKKLSNNNSKFSENLKKFFNHIQMQQIQNNYLKLLKNERNFKFIKREPNLKDLKNYIDEGKPIIVGLDLNKLKYKQKIDFPTHYVGVVGYDNKNIIIHTTWPENIEFQKIDKKIFNDAWESNGWTKDIIIPYL